MVVLLANTLTKGERYLAAGRKVVAFMSANHIDPDLAPEIFILEPARAP